MKKNEMIKSLLNRFSSKSLAQSVWLHTQTTNNIEDLTEEEVTNFYNLFQPKPITAAEIISKQQETKILRELRSVILKDAQYIGLYDPHDWTSFNEFMKFKSPLKKVLPFYKINEFDALKKQFKSMRSKYEQEAKVPGTKAWYHKNKFPKPSAN